MTRSFDTSTRAQRRPPAIAPAGGWITARRMEHAEANARELAPRNCRRFIATMNFQCNGSTILAGMKLGFLGLGRMGSGMARNLLRAGHEVTVFNRTREKAEALAADGARV